MPEDTTPTHSIKMPLMQRDVCPDCGHFHRVVIIKKCDCCYADFSAMIDEQKAAERAEREREDATA